MIKKKYTDLYKERILKNQNKIPPYIFIINIIFVILGPVLLLWFYVAVLELMQYMYMYCIW